jgi:cellulose biosynthesis protein BcsQ
MKVISFSIFKGGTGKTTSSVNAAVALARKGKKVLLVDLDQQASATRYLDLDPEQAPSLYEVFMGAKPAALAIMLEGTGPFAVRATYVRHRIELTTARKFGGAACRTALACTASVRKCKLWP